MEEVEEGPPGSLYVKSTLDAYVAAVIELWEQQRQNGLNKHDHPRGSALEDLLQKRARERDRNDRETFAHRGEGGGIAAGYTAAEFLKMQEVLLTGTAQTAQASPAPFHKLICWLASQLTTCSFIHIRIYGPALISFAATILSFVAKPAGSSSSPTSPSLNTRLRRALHLASLLPPSCRAGKRLRMGRRSLWGRCATATPCYVQWALWPSTSSGGGTSLGSQSQASAIGRTGIGLSCLSGSTGRRRSPTQQVFGAAGIHSVKGTHAMRGSGARAPSFMGSQSDR